MDSVVVSIRTAGAQDIGALDKLLAQSYTSLLKHDYPPSVQVTAIPVIAKVNPILVTSGSYFVAETQEGKIVGGGGWSRSVRGRSVGDVRHFVTRKDRLRQGIGRRLMQEVIFDAGHQGITQLNCLATRTAEPFYHALGFDRQKEVIVGLRPGIDFPVIRMSRPI